MSFHDVSHVPDLATSSRTPFHLIAGNGNYQIAELIAEQLGVDLLPCDVGSFTNGEIRVKLNESVRGAHVFIICSPRPQHINDDMMEILILADTLRRSSASDITGVVPLFPYARQDRKLEGRVPISSALMMDLLVASGVNRIITMDLHCGQIQGMTSKPVDNVAGNIEFVKLVKKTCADAGLDITQEVAVISPDAGGVVRAKNLKQAVGAAGIGFIVKERQGAGQIERMSLIGDVKDKVCFLVDDMCDTGGTLVRAAGVLKESGARMVYGCITHGLFCGRALDAINESCFEKVFVTNTLWQGEHMQKCGKLEVVDVAPLLAEVIKRAAFYESISTLFQVE